MNDRPLSCVTIFTAAVLLTSLGCGSGGTIKAPPAPTAYTIGSTVSGLSGTGLVLQNNGGNSLPVNGNGPFVFPTSIDSGSSYDVTAISPPSNPAQVCTVTNGSGMVTSNITNIQVTCTATSTASNEWTWESGSDSINQLGSYGAQGIAAPGNVPGARVYACSWTDASGAFWLFGGYGSGDLNDLWKYSSGEWTWVSGSNQTEQPGVYGTKGTAAPSNVPGARYQAVSWIDPSGNFWIFGGLGIDATGSRGDLNDLWKFSGGEWTWVSGSNTANGPGAAGESQPGVYGI
jgi:hypothetical protein